MKFISKLNVALVLAMLATALRAEAVTIEEAALPKAVTPVEMKIGGRVEVSTSAGETPAYEFQWPGIYFECSFEGEGVFFEIGKGDIIYHVLVDGVLQPPLKKPKRGYYHLRGLTPGAHTVRLEAVTESQDQPNRFGGFLADSKTRPLAPSPQRRMIEFIGDSHTVGYGNTSATRQCTREEVWSTTDTSQSFATLVAKHYGAEYQVNAYSGRGIVRNYNGFASFTLPELYPYILFDRARKVNQPEWKPAVVVINLGTNDFSTALNPGERWKTRDALREDFVETYCAFVKELRKEFPNTYFILAANDMADGEIQREVRKVVDKLTADGERRIGFVPFSNLKLTGCDWHPNVEDDQHMMADLVTYIDAHVGKW
ncbi:MAG TPA: GDSL-type esterase/lipase family protein [Opitutaceae bacterium]|nr:GDSL-type esterase/lipase family protein [Opitutaceae bacterium]